MTKEQLTNLTHRDMKPTLWKKLIDNNFHYNIIYDLLLN